MNQTFLYVEASEDLLKACMPDSVKSLLQVYEAVEQIVLVFQVLLYDDSTTEDLFYCSLAWSKIRSFFCQQFVSLGLELVEDITQSMILLGWLIRLMV